MHYIGPGHLIYFQVSGTESTYFRNVLSISFSYSIILMSALPEVSFNLIESSEM